MSRNRDEYRFVCFLLSALTLGIRRFFGVPQGYVRVIMAFGRFVREVGPGLRGCWSIWNMYERPSALVPVMEQVDDYEHESFFTRDGVNCLIDAVVFYSVKDAKKALFGVEDYRAAIKNLVQAVLRNQCGKLSARELLAAREQISADVREVLEQDTAPWGISVRLAEIKEIRIGVQGKGEDH